MVWAATFPSSVLWPMKEQRFKDAAFHIELQSTKGKRQQGVSRNNAIRGRVGCLQKINTVIERRDII